MKSQIANRKSQIANSSSSFFNTQEATVNNLTLPPLKESELLTLRIDDECDLPRLTEKVSVNEQIVGRKEDAKIRMRMVPAEYHFAREWRL